MPNVLATIAGPSDPNRIHLLWFLEVCHTVCILLAFFGFQWCLDTFLMISLSVLAFPLNYLSFRQLSVCVVPVFHSRHKRENGFLFSNYFKNILLSKISFKMLGFACLLVLSQILIYIIYLLTPLARNITLCFNGPQKRNSDFFKKPKALIAFTIRSHFFHYEVYFL